MSHYRQPSQAALEMDIGQHITTKPQVSTTPKPSDAVPEYHLKQAAQLKNVLQQNTKHVQNPTTPQFERHPQQTGKRVRIPDDFKKISAIMGFCMKCFHADGDLNGKGHQLVFCPRVSKDVRELAVLREAFEVGLLSQGNSIGVHGGAGVTFCMDKCHTNRMGALLCSMETVKKHHVRSTKSYGAEALPFFIKPCRTCNTLGFDGAGSHSAIDCGQYNPGAQKWVQAGQVLDKIYWKTQLSTSRGHVDTQSTATSHGPPQWQQPELPRVQAAAAQQTQFRKEGAPEIHPSRLALHADSESLAQAIIVPFEPDGEQKSMALTEMLWVERKSRPSEWMEVALAVQGHLIHQVFEYVMEGHLAEAWPPALGLLSILKARIEDLRLFEGA